MDELPPGYRFYPTEEELVSFFLKRKLEGVAEAERFRRIIPVVDIYQFDPWQLPQISGELCHGDPEQWFFFTPRQEREARGGRPNRITNSGYWKATGSPGYVYSNNRIIGVKKTMVFYKGKAPTGTKTKWKMIEYKATEEEEEATSSTPTVRHEFSVCRIYVNSGCLRAFDRRPTDRAQGNDGASGSSHRDQGQGVNIADRNSSSPDSASLEKDVQPYVNGDADSWGLCEWDQLTCP